MAFLTLTRVYALCGLLLIWGPAAVVSALSRIRAEPLFSSIQSAEPDSITSVRSFDSLINDKRRSPKGAAIPPQTSSDGLCYSYVLQGDDTCASIGREFGINEENIESFNMRTFAWNGCNKIKQGNFICLSSGKPPMPVAFQGAVCGPQVPGTVRPNNMADLESLNPCPADQCCDLSTATCRDSCTPKMTPQGGITDLVADAATSILAAATGVKIATKTQAESKKMSTTSTITIPTSTWRAVIYSEMDCEGDYYYVEGLDQTYEDCIDLHGGLSTDWDEKVSCRWYTDGGESWTNCDESPLKYPAAWSFENAFCTVYSTRNCTNPDNDSQIFTSAGRKGCTSGYNAPLSVAEWNSMHCNIISIHDTS